MSLSWEDLATLNRNQQAFDRAKELPYAGTWIAFNKEGTEIILNSAASEEDLWEQLRARGFDPSDHLVTYVEGPGDVIDRGFILARGHPAATDMPVTGWAPMVGGVVMRFSSTPVDWLGWRQMSRCRNDFGRSADVVDDCRVDAQHDVPDATSFSRASV